MQYDDATHAQVTLGGVGATTPVTLTNVAAGVNPTDAVNFSQLTTLSTSTSTGLSSLSTALTQTAASGISTAQSGVDALSTALSSSRRSPKAALPA